MFGQPDLSLAPVVHTVAVPSHLVRRLWVAVGGAVFFLVVATVHGALVPGFDAGHQSVSALALAPLGWVQAVNFFVLGAAFLATVRPWQQVLAGGTGGRWYPSLTAVLGLSFIAAGCVPQDPAPGYDPAGLALQEPTATGLLHLAIAGVAAASSTALMFIVASRLSGDPNWPGWAFYTRGMAFLTILCIVVFAFWSTRPSGYAGSFERAAVIIPTIWGASLLRRLGRGAPFMRIPPLTGRSR